MLIPHGYSYMDLRFIASFTKIHEAYLAKIHLDMEGIQSFVFDEYIIGVHPFYSNAVGGVKLTVPKSEYNEARLIIEKHFEEQKEHLESLSHQCPNCHSTDIRQKTIFHIIFSILCIFIFGIFCILFFEKNKCNNCGHRQAW